MNYLVIVESPSKARTIGKFLGRNYKVLASQGHLIDLPKSQLGINLDDSFTPRYITIRGKGQILKQLRDAGKKAKAVYLAADPDREGEAICWHLRQALNIDEDKPCRVEFNEITKSAIKDAFKNPRLIDSDRVDAQQARRILDRLVGYQISPLLWRNIRSGLSAGRVQSVAVRLICDREDEISSFVEQEYWTLEALLHSGGEETRFKALLDRYRQKKIELGNREQVDEVMAAVKGADFIIEKITRTRRQRRPFPPFITSSLQQEASSKLGFTSRKTMSLAQQLYEGINIGKGETVGLITYIRTDSTRVSGQSQNEARELIGRRFGADYVPENPPRYRSRKGAQEAHEAIRPTAVVREPDFMESFLTRDQLRLYKLIWDRFIASQMAAAVYDQVRVRINAGEYSFKATGSSLLFPGYLLLYRAEGQDKDTILPVMEEGQKLDLADLLPEQHFTQPPPRYNEASLVKTLEEKGIGRPSTYVPIIETIQSRGYVLKENKAFMPAELGYVVVELMKQYFPEIIDVGFTAKMESQLDDIADGKLERFHVLDSFYRDFKERLAVAEQEIKRIELTAEVSDETCPQCGRNLIYKHGRFGRFLACPGYPECKYTKNIVKETGVSCPLCNNMLVERRSKKGRLFYGCSGFPECRFSVWDKPLAEKCPHCDALMVEAVRRKKNTKRCSNKECDYKTPVAAGKAAVDG
jgi:DNA topoisomerase I